jgi:hypothetical protein
MPPLTAASISLELLQDCLGTLEQITTGITNLGVDASTSAMDFMDLECMTHGT